MSEGSQRQNAERYPWNIINYVSPFKKLIINRELILYAITTNVYTLIFSLNTFRT